jgi:diacylglycerol O-acyltransferase
MERLTGLDAAFLYIETPSHHMHVSMVSVFDTSTMPGGYSFEKVRAIVEERIPMIPMFRRRLVEVPFRLHHPIWVDDPDFDLDYHLRRIGAPPPGGIKELCDLAGEFTSRQLDRSRPLWELCIVEGLENGNIGVLAKVHHSTIDGVSGAEVMVHLFDLEPAPATPPEPPPEPPGPERVPSDLELVGYAAWSLARQPFRIAAALPGTIRSVVNVARRRRASEGPTVPAPFAAPATTLNAAITPHRNVAAVTLPFDDVKAVKRALGTTVNDVVLAVCAGALRRYLDTHGELPEDPLVAVVPISVRNDPEIESGGSNQVSAMFTSLATDVTDPRERLLAIAEVTRAAKEEHNAIGAKLLQDWAEFAAPRLFARASRLYSSMNLADRHRPIHNVIISNVPGPPFPLYLAGAQLELLCPLGPVMEGAALNITVISYMDRLDVGLIACREVVPDLWDLAEGFHDALEELTDAAGTRQPVIEVAEPAFAAPGRANDPGAVTGPRLTRET